MTVKQQEDPSVDALRASRRRRTPFESSVQAAIRRGFVIGREVFIGRIPGVIVGYNIAGFGRFVGAVYPIVVRTALGITKCNPDELELVR